MFVHESDLLRALIRRSASSHRRRPSAATSSRFGLHPCSCSCRPSSCTAARAAAFNLPIPLTPTREALIVLLDRFRSADESGLQFTPNRANHECLATIVAHVLESVQQGCREQGTERNRRRIRSVQYTSRLCPTTTLPAVEHESRWPTNPHRLAKIAVAHIQLSQGVCV
jgi:hypothetical protein